MKQLFVFLSLIVFLVGCQPKNYSYLKLQGEIFGTYYHVIYQPVQDNDQIDEGLLLKLQEVNTSLSTYDKQSVISQFNNSDTGCVIDPLMKEVVVSGLEVFKNSNGAFDMTVGPLVNAWGFGFKEKENMTDVLVDSLMQFVGMEHIHLNGNVLAKEKPGIMLASGAIAKGFGVDVAADFLISQGVQNYMVEIGGEIRAQGINHKGTPWRVGIDKPIDDRAAMNRELQDVLSLSHIGLATSGNYRNFYIKDGKKYAHTIDPKSGYPVQHSLLSASIIAPKCMVADAYATACMVLGLEQSLEMIEQLDGVEGYFIYVDEEGQNKVNYTDGFAKIIVKP